MTIFLQWLIPFTLWNLAGFTAVMLDKQWARQGEWRIRERTFFIWALAFGAVGIFIGMHVFRHKTRHLTFVIGMPILCLLNAVGVYFIWRQGWLF